MEKMEVHFSNRLFIEFKEFVKQSPKIKLRENIEIYKYENGLGYRR